jgi:superfamily I DNA/RNA helicase
MTRAKDLLYLSYAESRTVAGVPEVRERSRFLDEIGDPQLAELEPVDVDDVIQYEPWGRRGK